MTQCEAFEAHHKHLDLATEKDAWGRDRYKHQCVDAMWSGWKAGAAAERERCAKICESRQTPGTGSVAILNGAADAIREGAR